MGLRCTGALLILVLLHPACRRERARSAEDVVAWAKESTGQFVTQRGRCPTSEEELVGERFQLRPFTDPWGSRLRFDCRQTPEGALVRITSPGPDRRLGTTDDVVSVAPDQVPR